MRSGIGRLVWAGSLWCAISLAAQDTVLLLVRRGGTSGTAVEGPVTIGLSLPGEASWTLHTEVSNWVALDRLEMEVGLDEEAPEGLQVLVHVVDWDGLWFQCLLPGTLSPAATNRVAVDVSPSAPGWEPLGHHSAWHRRSLMEPREVGVRIFGGSSYTGRLSVVSATGIPCRDESPPHIRWIRPNDAAPPVFGLYEMRFGLPDRYANPFDPSEVSVDARVETPSGETISFPAFYYQDYFRTISDAGERILPQGRPEWRLRFSAREEGRHRVTLTVRDRFGEAASPPTEFVAGPPKRPGIVQPSTLDPRFLEYSDGSPYFPVGYNIRSPFDERMNAQFPWRFRHPEGSLAYARYFRDMEAAGANLVEIWASAWCMGLEWTPTHPGYHGIGQYNLIHAWERDQVFRLADQHGLNVNLVLNNHGRLSAYCDPEWKDNPFNKANGGYLEAPMEWFRDERAIEEYKRQLRYEVARYGWNPHLFAWELWSELDLAGSRAADRPHFDQDVILWHQRISRYLRSLDYHGHMISTHVSSDYRRQNPALVKVPELCVAAVDAYHSSRDPLEITRLQVATAAFNNPFGKPVLITEFGGSPMAADLIHLRREVHAALWSSASTAIAGTPLFWWWQVIEEENFFPMYRAISNFMKGEDRRDPELLPTPVRLVDEQGRAVPEARVTGTLLASPRQAFGWLFVNAPRFSQIDPEGDPSVAGLTLRLNGTEGAIYRIEFWDTLRGEVLNRADVRVREGVAEIPVPAFARDVAFKAKRR